MKTLTERITELMQEMKWDVDKVADVAGVSSSAVYQWLGGGSKIIKSIGSIESAQRLQKASGFSALWLAKGSGPRKVDTGAANVGTAAIGGRSVPLISHVQAGAWSETIDNYAPGDGSDRLMTDLDLSDSAFALEIKGRSMEPEFTQGDRVIIDPAVYPCPGDFVVAKNGEDEATFKKYRPRGMSERGEQIIELVPLNPDFPSLRSDVTPLRIIGTMVEHRKYRRR